MTATRQNANASGRSVLPCRMYRKSPYGAKNPRQITKFFMTQNDLNAGFERRNEYIDRFCRTRCLSLTTSAWSTGRNTGLNRLSILALDSLQHLQDTAHARIHDRLLEMCVSIHFTGENFRKETHAGEHDRRKNVLIKYSLTLLFVSSESITNHNTKQYDYCVVFWRS